MEHEVRILHIIDDEIFANGIVSMFERNNPELNIYLMNIDENANTRFEISPKIIKASYNSLKYKKILLDKSLYDIVFIHGMYQQYKKELISLIHQTTWI